MIPKRNQYGYRIKPIRSGVYQNPVGKSGAVIHVSKADGFPRCGKNIRGVYYTDTEPNCDVCLGRKPDHDTGGGKGRPKAADHREVVSQDGKTYLVDMQAGGLSGTGRPKEDDQ